MFYYNSVTRYLEGISEVDLPCCKGHRIAVFSRHTLPPTSLISFLLMRWILVLLLVISAQAFRAPPLCGARIGGLTLAAPFQARQRRALQLEATLYPISGVDSLPLIQQQLIFVGVFLGLGAGTTGLLKGFEVAEKALPAGWFVKWRSTWPLLGAVYVLAGLAHFGVKDAFLSIFPPQGTWGLWYLPGSPEFHVAWTGAAEFLGGVGLLGGAVLSSYIRKDRPDDKLSLAFWYCTVVYGVYECKYIYTIYTYIHTHIYYMIYTHIYIYDIYKHIYI